MRKQKEDYKEKTVELNKLSGVALHSVNTRLESTEVKKNVGLAWFGLARGHLFAGLTAGQQYRTREKHSFIENLDYLGF